MLVNQKVSELITTVFSALKNTNPGKIQQIIQLAENSSALKKIFRKPQIQNFLIILKTHSFLNDCNSFVLSQPFKLQPQHIEIRTSSGALEDLVSFIRANVLQFPRKKIEELETELLTHSELTPGAVSRSKESQIFHLQPQRSRSDNLESHRFWQSSQNFIANNIVAIGRYQKYNVESKAKKSSRTNFDQTRTNKTRMRR